MRNNEVLTSAQIFDADIEDWRQLAGPIRARFTTDSLNQGLAFANRIGDVAAQANHYPDITLTSSQVIITLSSRDAGGVTDRDIALARMISTIAAETGLAADTANLVQAEFALNTDSSDRVAPFYSALLRGEPIGIHSRGDLVDPAGQVNTVLWWQEPKNDSRFPLSEPVVPQKWHLDIWVSHDEAASRISAAIAAGGHMVSDKAAPSYWVLEDPDGNRACICTPIVH